ncbi:MAG TPA: PEGA domain-containing protein [Pyrinomonadaceae bacterium]|nr:PEGA domain-containing protein [Pyrinomonadaceae bacterium]
MANSVRVTKRGPTRESRPRAVPTATLNVSVNPPDSTILLDGEDLRSKVDATGAVNLKPGTYIIRARKEGYREEQRNVILYPGQNAIFELRLTQLLGRISVMADVPEAEINISGVGSYAGSVTEIELKPGAYEVTVTKPGYQTAERRALVTPEHLTFVDVKLEPIKKPARPTLTAMSLSTSNDGKYTIITLTGSSDTATAQSGSIEVTLDGQETFSGSRNVRGLLTGYPSRIDFVPLDNVAEYSFKEAPGIANQWGRIVLRIRPKKTNRTIRFLINWQVIGTTSR